MGLGCGERAALLLLLVATAAPSCAATAQTREWRGACPKPSKTKMFGFRRTAAALAATATRTSASLLKAESSSSSSTRRWLSNSTTSSSTTTSRGGGEGGSGGNRVMKVGPIRLFAKNPPAFQWQAAVDRATGLAQARETSEIPTTSPLFQSLTKKKKSASIMSRRLFGHYVPWLCSGRVTLGLLRAVAVTGGGFEIRDRIFGLALLNMGMPRFEQRSTAKVGSETTTQVSQCQWIVPITGGLLSCEGSKQGVAATRGEVVFALERHETQDTNGATPQPSYRLVTRLVDYRPAVVRTTAANHPAGWVRTGVYLGSQSLIHAWVMWRFHGWCRNQPH